MNLSAVSAFLHRLKDLLTTLFAEITTRIMHQIHFIAVQSPLDSTTYSLTSLLLSMVVESGGVGVEGQSDEALEQLTLAVAIIAACVGECESAINDI